MGSNLGLKTAEIIDLNLKTKRWCSCFCERVGMSCLCTWLKNGTHFPPGPVLQRSQELCWIKADTHLWGALKQAFGPDKQNRKSKNLNQNIKRASSRKNMSLVISQLCTYKKYYSTEKNSQKILCFCLWRVRIEAMQTTPNLNHIFISYLQSLTNSTKFFALLLKF